MAIQRLDDRESDGVDVLEHPLRLRRSTRAVLTKLAHCLLKSPVGATHELRVALACQPAIGVSLPAIGVRLAAIGLRFDSQIAQLFKDPPDGRIETLVPFVSHGDKVMTGARGVNVSRRTHCN